MVGGLIEQQHIGLRHQRLRQGHALLGPAGERAHHRIGIKVQALQRLAHPLLPVPAVESLNFALHRVQVANPLAVLVDQSPHARQPRADRFKNRCVRLQHRLLSHVGNAGVGLHLEAAVVGLFQTAQNFEQRRLAGAVAPDESDALLRL